DPAVAGHPAVVAALAGPGTPRRLAATTSTAHDRLRPALEAAGLLGDHLVRDAALALALTDARLEHPDGVADLADSLATMTPLPHRLTPVGSRRGVRFVDDSISTVPESAVAAARTYLEHGPVTLLLGGDDRVQDVAPIATLLADDRVRAVLLPPLGDRWLEPLSAVAGERVEWAEDLAGAVELAAERTPAGGTVLLSPAAPSFASYRDFVARGEHFATLVSHLP
ncbi:MAG: glutamate ligase domain-containing protein, partial [Actinomycetota bacterium]